MPTRKTQRKTLLEQGTSLCSKTAAVVWLGLCTQTVTAGAATAAEANASKERPSSLRQNRARSQMGVSVTVLPTCAIRMPDGSAVGTDGQPLSIQCTQDSAYNLGVSGGSSKLASKGSSGRQTQAYSVEKADAGDREVTILSIDF